MLKTIVGFFSNSNQWTVKYTKAKKYNLFSLALSTRASQLKKWTLSFSDMKKCFNNACTVALFPLSKNKTNTEHAIFDKNGIVSK